MRTQFLGLASVCTLFLSPPVWASDTPPPAEPAPVRIRLTGELLLAKHLRFGLPAVAITANGQAFWLDYRQAEGKDRLNERLAIDVRHVFQVTGRLELLAGPDGKKEPTVVASRIDFAHPTAASSAELEVTGKIWVCRHIDPVTGQGAATLVPSGQEFLGVEFPAGMNFPLDLRQLKGGVPDFGGPLVVKGTWGREKRLVVTEIRPAGRDSGG